MQLPRHLKIAAGSGGAAIFGVLFGWVMFPAILKSQLKKEMAITPKTDVRQMWQKIPFALDFKLFIFNYTNHEEVQNGAVPIVKEIGPFYFEEWKEKVEVVDHENNDTINYKKVDAFYFKPEKSGPGLTGEEEVIIPHVFMLSLITIVSRDKPAMLNTVGKAVNGIFENPSSVFLKVKVMDIFFRGIIINCAKTEFAPKAVCTALKKEANTFQFEPNNQLRFSLLGMRNASVDRHVISVKRGKKNVMEVGSVVGFDGEPQLNLYQGQCNEFRGTDGTVFPPFLKETDDLQSYSTDLCKSFHPKYFKKTSYKGIKTNQYRLNFSHYRDPEYQCLCETPDKCPPDGLLDLTKCMSAPLYASLPHFLGADPELLKNVKGLHPDPEEHIIKIDFEPISGTPMNAQQRVQFSMVLIQTDKIELCKNLPNTYAPIFWIEEQVALNKTFVNMLKHQLFIPLRAVGVLRWLLVSFGTLGALGSMVFHFKDKMMNFAVSRGSASVTKIEPGEVEHQTGQGPGTPEKEVEVISQVQEPTKVEI